MRTMLVTLLLLGLAAPAAAFTPNIGDRAADMYGKDAVTDQVVRLSDHFGHWTFIDFWASWCGPCMGELPNLLAETRDYRKAGKLHLFTVSLDDMETATDLNNVISENGIDYPVVVDGNGWDSVQAKEWGIRSIPATFLVDPLGNIIATNLRGETLAPALDFFLNYKGAYAPIGVRIDPTINADKSVTLKLCLSNPRGQALDVKVDYAYMRMTYAEDDPEHQNPPIDREFIDEGGDTPEASLTLEPGDFGDCTSEFTVPVMENTQRVYYEVLVRLPETESLLDGEGIWVSNSGNVKLDEPPAAASS